MGQHNCKRCTNSLVSKIIFRRDHFIRREIISVLSFEQDDGQRHVTTILNLHHRWKKLKHEKHCSEALERRMLHHAAKLCYYWWLSNSNLVCQVLYRIYQLDSHFSIVYNKIISFINGEPQSDDWPIPIAHCNVDPNEYAKVIYFLRHANNCKMTINGVRFSDMPISSFSPLPPWVSTVLRGKPRLLQLLLQHGSILEPDNDLPDDSWKYYLNPSRYLRYTISILWMRNVKSLPTEYIINDLRLQRSILIVKLLLRVIPQLQRRDLTFNLFNYSPGKLLCVTKSSSFIDDLSERGIIWNLRERYLEPSELRHLCRCVIRRHLRKMWKLPLGIFELPLPNLLQKYLNLEDD
ncbi:uncharacterized protein [Centruroides vittatus]|uniref:uncharacterized protein n=1 Tax=Centruroides vittatus TaxID=120091 RepID=UPI00350E97DB